MDRGAAVERIASSDTFNFPYDYGRNSGKRQVTLIQGESLAAIASHLGLETLAPEVLRRNLVTRGINLLALKDRKFRIGDAVLEMTGECHPCSHLEETLAWADITRREVLVA
jgi:MOSC domain-containing protein YiiM